MDESRYVFELQIDCDDPLPRRRLVDNVDYDYIYYLAKNGLIRQHTGKDILVPLPNIPLPKRPEHMPDDLWAAYVEAHEHTLNKMEAKGSTDQNYYYKLMRKRIGGLSYDLCLKYFRMDAGF